MASDSISTRVLIPVLVLSLVGGGIGGALITRMTFKTDAGRGVLAPNRVVEQKTYIEESESINAIQKVAPAVLSIVATKDLPTFRQNPLDPFFFFENDPLFRDIPGFEFQFPRRQEQKQLQEPQTKRQRVSGGTGFIVEADGLALTNKHVVSDKDADYTAITNDGKEFDVEVVSRDPLNDLAVIQLHEKAKEEKGRKTGEKKNFGAKPENLSIVTFGDSGKLKVGQKVFAIGNARGQYENSVTAGIVSATGRQIEASDNSGTLREILSGLIQTDAAINFGNSGGPLINLGGEVIGVNTAIDAEATGVGFAIPINEVKPLIESVKKHGRIIRAFLGVRHQILTKESAEQLGLKGLEYGALLVGDRTKGEFAVIPGSPAEKVGLRVDDVILEVDGEKVTPENPLQSIVRRHSPGDTLSLKVSRGGSTITVKVTLAEAKEQE